MNVVSLSVFEYELWSPKNTQLFIVFTKLVGMILLLLDLFPAFLVLPFLFLGLRQGTFSRLRFSSSAMLIRSAGVKSGLFSCSAFPAL